MASRGFNLPVVTAAWALAAFGVIRAAELVVTGAGVTAALVGVPAAAAMVALTRLVAR
jgi:hypothetical protein